MSPHSALILGAGARVGKSVAQKFANEGFKVAVVSRSLDPALVKLADASTTADFSNPAIVKDIFAWARSAVGIPSVVVYNAYANTNAYPFAVPLAQFKKNLAVNTSSVYAAIQEALVGFESLESDSPKTFIFTGNILNIRPIPTLLSMGTGKTATAHLIEVAAKSFIDKGYGFYYADERRPDGSPIADDLGGEAAAEFYYQLSQKKEQGPWEATFVSGSGYMHFDE